LCLRRASSNVHSIRKPQQLHRRRLQGIAFRHTRTKRDGVAATALGERGLGLLRGKSGIPGAIWVTTLVENTVNGPNLQAEHGLAFVIRTGRHRLLFDTGQSDLVRQNALK
jgi:hypothetical protein